MYLFVLGVTFKFTVYVTFNSYGRYLRYCGLCSPTSERFEWFYHHWWAVLAQAVTWRPHPPLFSCEPKGLLMTAFSTSQKLLPLFVPFDSLSITVNCGAVLGICQISKLNMILTGNKNTCANISLVVSQGGKTLRDTISKGPVSGLVCPCMVFLSSEIIVLLCYGVFYC